jgi:hypothetical protein
MVRRYRRDRGRRGGRRAMAPALIDPYLWVADDGQASEAHVGVKGIRVAVWVLGEPTCMHAE